MVSYRDQNPQCRLKNGLVGHRVWFTIHMFVFFRVKLLKCVLRELLEEKDVQKNLLQVHLNGTH